MGIKINLGSGVKRYEGFLNIDENESFNPDYVIQLDDVNIGLPFEDDSVEEIKAEHILEHIGDGFIPLLVELWRVAEHGCVLDIVVPHHQHDVFFGDPTHKRPITVPAMHMFSKKHCSDHPETYASTNLAEKYGIDWEMIHFEYEYDPFYVPMLNDFFNRKEQGKVSPEEDFAIQRLMREATNVALNTKIKMIAVKK